MRVLDYKAKGESIIRISVNEDIYINLKLIAVPAIFPFDILTF